MLQIYNLCLLFQCGCLPVSAHRLPCHTRLTESRRDFDTSPPLYVAVFFLMWVAPCMREKKSPPFYVATRIKGGGSMWRSPAGNLPHKHYLAMNTCSIAKIIDCLDCVNQIWKLKTSAVEMMFSLLLKTISRAEDLVWWQEYETEVWNWSMKLKYETPMKLEYGMMDAVESNINIF